MKVKAPAEKNFRRARVKPGRPKATRSWLSWRLIRVAVAALVVMYGLYRGCVLVLDATTLKVSRIVVTGNVRLSTGEVQHLVHGLYGTHILTADLLRYRGALLDSPWVADADLRRVLPSTVEISVTERRPMGISRLGRQLYLVDREGTVIDEFGPHYAEFDLPIIDGLAPAPRDGEPAIDPARIRLAADVIDALAADAPLARRLSQVDVSDPTNAAVLLDDDPALLYLGKEHFRERLQSYLELAPTLRERVSEIDHVDLRFGGHLFVKPRGRAVGTGGRPSKGARSY